MYNTSRILALAAMASNLKALRKNKGDTEYDKMYESLKECFISLFSKNAINR